MSRLLRFYRGEDTDTEGRLLHEMWAWSDDDLEDVHDFIQWLFPLAEPSRFNPNAPLLSEEDIAAFKPDERLRGNLRKSFGRFLTFVGLALTETSQVVEGQNFSARVPDVGAVPNHNWLRTTRVLGSLKFLGLEQEARALYDRLDALCSSRHFLIAGDTFQFWTEAVQGLPFHACAEAILRGHASKVSCLAFAADGRRLASSGGLFDDRSEKLVSREVRLWDLATCRERAVLKGHSDLITLDGKQFLEKQRQDPALAAIPVIAVTALEEADCPGTAAYIQKPFQPPGIAGGNPPSLLRGCYRSLSLGNSSVRSCDQCYVFTPSAQGNDRNADCLKVWHSVPAPATSPCCSRDTSEASVASRPRRTRSVRSQGRVGHG